MDGYLFAARFGVQVLLQRHPQVRISLMSASLALPGNSTSLQGGTRTRRPRFRSPSPSPRFVRRCWGCLSLRLLLFVVASLREVANNPG